MKSKNDDHPMIHWRSLLSGTETADAFEYGFHRLPCVDLALERHGDTLRLMRGRCELTRVDGVHGQLPLLGDDMPLLWLTTTRSLFPEAIRVCAPTAGSEAARVLAMEDLDGWPIEAIYPQKSREKSVDNLDNELRRQRISHG